MILSKFMSPNFDKECQNLEQLNNTKIMNKL
jgi:hypothetical protein